MKLHFILLIIFSFLQTNTYADSFEIEGSDLLVGVGAKDIAHGGASTAGTNDIYATFYNPAGLVEIQSMEFSVSTQADGVLAPVNFIAFAYAFPIEALNLKVALALSYIPKLYMKTSGAFREDDFESIFLRFTLPSLSSNFSGDIDSKTDDYRFSLAFTQLHNPTFSFGVSLGYINCATTFAGVELEDTSNFIYMTTKARTTAFNLGAKYYANEDLTFGVTFKNLGAKLAVDIHTVDNNGESTEYYDVSIPYDFSGGLSWKYDESIQVSADYQAIFGEYSDYDIDFQLLRLGGTLHGSFLDYHLGAIIPIKLYSSKLDSFELPFPFLPTAGLGWHNEYVDLSMAFYIHPVTSLHLKKPSPSLDISLGFKF